VNFKREGPERSDLFQESKYKHFQLLTMRTTNKNERR
jgi:hypothetical protein